LREGKWDNWFEKIQEYDIKIKPLKAIKGQGLCKLIANGDSIDGMISISVREPSVDSKWYVLSPTLGITKEIMSRGP
jgi:hypothetical protein